MAKKPPFEPFRRGRVDPAEAARMNTPEAITARCNETLSRWDKFARKKLDSSNPGDTADARAILNEVDKLRRFYLNGLPLSPQEASELFLAATYLAGCWFNLSMRPYGELITVGESCKQGGKKGTSHAHGSPEERAALYVQMRERYAALAAENPLWGHYELTDQLAAEFEISGRRVRDHVPNTVNPRPHRKKIKTVLSKK